MKKIATITTALLLALSPAMAMDRCGAGKCGSGMQKESRAGVLHKVHEVDGYRLVLESEKPLSVGDNGLVLRLYEKGQPADAKVKVKFFMPEMPGMPYMEFKTKGRFKEGIYRTNINLSMGGTWQYQVKFKTADSKVHKLRGSVNL